MRRLLMSRKLVCAVNGSVDALFDGSRTASEGRTDA